MPSFGSLGRFFGRTVSEGAAFAAGVAVAPALEPVVQDVKNEAWSNHSSKPLDPDAAAAIVAEDVAQQPWGESEALLTGISKARFDRLLGEALNAPGIGMLFEARRRNVITAAQFAHGLRKAKLENLWDAPLTSLLSARLSPQAVALGIVRSVITDPGLMVRDLDTSGGVVPAYPVSPIDPIAEAAAAGVDKERLRVMVGSIGLPMSVQQAASALFRNIIQRPDFNRAVVEGDTRPEWGDAILEQARQIPSVSDYVNARIRGWITDDEMYAGTAKHGMSQEDTHLLYLRTGRPAAPGQMATAAARGIVGPDGVPMDRTQFLKGIAESDIRPEWGEMLWESRFLYPPLFQLTRLVQAGAISAEVAAEWATKDRYPPEVVDALKSYWAAPATGAAKALTVADIQALYDSHKWTRAEAVTQLEELGYSNTVANLKLDVLDAKEITAAIGKAVTAAHKLFVGASLTRGETESMLRDLGFSDDTLTRIIDVWAIEYTYTAAPSGP